jgi:hypothetical protein
VSAQPRRRQDSRHETPFEFARVPHAIEEAFDAGVIDEGEARIIRRFYCHVSRQRFPTWVVRGTLAQLVELTGWRQTPDWLYRCLCDLRVKGFIDFPTMPGRKGRVYVIRLRIERVKPSEDGPSTRGEDWPSVGLSKHGGEGGQASGRAVAAAASESEDASEPGRTRRERAAADNPSTRPPGPRTGEAAEPPVMRDSAPQSDQAVRAPIDEETRTKALSEGELRKASLDIVSVEGWIDRVLAAPAGEKTGVEKMFAARVLCGPHLGDEGYLHWLDVAAGRHLTAQDRLRQRLLHLVVVRAKRPFEDEAVFLAGLVDEFDAKELG